MGHHGRRSARKGERMSTPRIGVIGLGNMGGRITRRIVESGQPVTGYDPVPGRAEEAGATAAASVAELTRAADHLLLSLPDSTVIEKVVLGEDGVLANSRDGQIVVDLSTAAPSSTVKLHEAFAARGVEFVDAGISGGAAAADKGTLTLMVGGSADALTHLEKTLEPFSATVFAMGGSGAGHTTKVLNNFLNAVSLAATAETLVAGKKAGLDMHRLLEVFNASTGVNFATLNRFPHIVDGDYLEGGLTSTLMMKDVVLYVNRLRELGVPTLNSAGPMASFALAQSLGYADQISNRVVDAIGDAAGGVRLHDEEAR
uniref:NAD(P)-dependent oxidoreductase n=1 Tax=Amycolatopsis acidiphila TaxID=715473 RepID=UPI003570ACF3